MGTCLPSPPFKVNDMKSTKPPVLVLALVAAGLVASSGCKSDATGAANLGSERPPQRVTIVPAKQEQVTDYLELAGRTAASESVKIQARVSGFLQKKHFVDGQRVNAGDLLFTIEPEEYEAVYQQSVAQIEVAKTRLDMAQKTFARSQKLLDNSAISREEFEQNQAAVAEAQSLVTAANADAARVKLNVDYTQVKTPITGRVDRALLDEGNYVNGGLGGGTVLTTVVNDQPIKAIASVDENVRLKFMRRQRDVAGDNFKQADKLTELQIPCDLQLQDEKDFPHKGILEYGETVIDQQTGTSQLRGIFDNQNGLLTPGMFVRLRIPVSKPYDAVLIPEVAIGTDQATKFVYVVNGENVVESRTVELGDRKGSMRVIKSGVNVNDSVVVVGLQLIQPKMKVDPVLQEEPSKEVRLQKEQPQEK